MPESISNEIERRILTLLLNRERVLVAIDGRSASGKTTLAASLQSALHANVLHMDDFFLRPEQRSGARLGTPGGNVDYERFLAEALRPLLAGKPFSYRPYSCHAGAFCAPVIVPVRPVTIVEGAYSRHPALSSAYDLSVFLTVSPQTQLARIRRRNGEAAAEQFRTLWIPLEEAYFAGCDVEARADMRFCTDASEFEGA